MKRLLVVILAFSVLCLGVFGCAPTNQALQDIEEPANDGTIVWYWPADCSSECGTLPEEGFTWPLLTEPTVHDEGYIRMMSGTEGLWMDFIIYPIADFDENVYSFVVAYGVGSGYKFGQGCIYDPEKNRYVKHDVPPTPETYSKIYEAGAWFNRFVYKGGVEKP